MFKPTSTPGLLTTDLQFFSYPGDEFLLSQLDLGLPYQTFSYNLIVMYAEHEISPKLKQFIFEFVDSVELIEVLLFIRNHSEKWFSAAQISMELRSNPDSILNRLSRLATIGLLEQNKDLFRFHPKSSKLNEISSELSNEYFLRRHAIFELIFSSSKTARQFADAFIITKPNKTNGDS